MGTVTAACLARVGHEVVAVDVNAAKVDELRAGRSPVHEKGLEAIVLQTVGEGLLSATTSTREAVEESDVALICVGTPSRQDGTFDTGAIRRVAEEIAEALDGRRRRFTVILRSTLDPAMIAESLSAVLAHGAGLAVVPEFMREGSAVEDFQTPPFVLVGSDDAASADVAHRLFAHIQAPFIRTDLGTPMLVKLASNAFHALKIAFANEVGDVCEALGLDAQTVMHVFSSDTRLNASAAYLKPGFAFGGSCLPKDLRALRMLGRTHDLETPLLSSILASNEEQIARAVRAVLATGAQRVGMVGLAFKPGTDDLRESPLVALAKRLIGEGCDLRILDPGVQVGRLVGVNRAYVDRELPHIAARLCDSPEQLLAHAELVVIGHRNAAVEEALHTVSPRRVLDLTRGGFTASGTATEAVEQTAHPI